MSEKTQQPTAKKLEDAKKKGQIPRSKLFEYLNAGRPILGVTRNTAAEKIIVKTGAGFVVDPGDVDAISRMLERLVLDRVGRRSDDDHRVHHGQDHRPEAWSV